MNRIRVVNRQVIFDNLAIVNTLNELLREVDLFDFAGKIKYNAEY